jgi:uncharacterized membrane protein
MESRGPFCQASASGGFAMNGHYDGFGFYHGPDDPRLIVPKRIPIMGWTINVSHPKAPLLMLLTFGLIGLGILGQLVG